MLSGQKNTTLQNIGAFKHLNQLELFFLILSHLDIKATARFSQTCLAFYQIINSKQRSDHALNNLKSIISSLPSTNIKSEEFKKSLENLFLTLSSEVDKKYTKENSHFQPIQEIHIANKTIQMIEKTKNTTNATEKMNAITDYKHSVLFKSKNTPPPQSRVASVLHSMSDEVKKFFGMTKKR